MWGSDAADLVVASIVQVPAGGALGHGSHDQVATRLRGEEREDRLADILGKSPIASWLNGSAPSFHVESLPHWAPSGYNTGEWSELVLAPVGPDPTRPVLSVHCRVNTGWVAQRRGSTEGLILATERSLT